MEGARSASSAGDLGPHDSVALKRSDTTLDGREFVVHLVSRVSIYQVAKVGRQVGVGVGTVVRARLLKLVVSASSCVAKSG